MNRQQFLHRPAMIGDLSRHGRRHLLGAVQTRMRCANVRDRAHQAHPLVQRQGLACQPPATTRQRSEAFTERRVQPLDVRRIDDPVALRATSERFAACGRAIDKLAIGPVRSQANPGTTLCSHRPILDRQLVNLLEVTVAADEHRP